MVCGGLFWFVRLVSKLRYLRLNKAGFCGFGSLAEFGLARGGFF